MQTLTVLNLSDNIIGDVGAQALVEALRINTVNSLSISCLLD